ncbi:hypothetical protein CFOL_v3_27897, partial [Cephalotus follicularis]
PIKILSQEEIQTKRKTSLCFNCDEKFGPGHKCKARMSLLLLDRVTDEYDADIDSTPDEHLDIDQLVEALPTIRLHALIGKMSPKTVRLTGTINGNYVQVLIDGESTHNFIQEQLAVYPALPITPSKHFTTR